MRHFFLSEIGATSTDFAVITAGIIGLGVVVFTPIQNGTSELAFDISASLEGNIDKPLSDYFEEWVEWYNGIYGRFEQSYENTLKNIQGLSNDELGDFLSLYGPEFEGYPELIEQSNTYLDTNPDPTLAEAQAFLDTIDQSVSTRDGEVEDLINDTSNIVDTPADAINENIDYLEMQYAKYNMYLEEAEKRGL